ncbi:MAG TPA: hypothetical protein VGJ59_01615 [Jatrophihabitantaceae bacterium]|jgi:hypothetical protein
MGQLFLVVAVVAALRAAAVLIAVVAAILPRCPARRHDALKVLRALMPCRRR